MKLLSVLCWSAAMLAASSLTTFAQEAQPAAEQKANTALVPVSKGAGFERRHEQFVERGKSGIDLLFIGDSITDFWARAGKPVWDKHYASRNAANFGISGDRTQHILWRIEHGELDNIKPKVVVLLIGTNNTGLERSAGNVPRNTQEEAAAGVKAVVAKIREKLPESRLLLLAIFPRGNPGDIERGQIKFINEQLKQVADADDHITFLDIGDKFLTADGTIPSDIMADKLHPDEKGYQIWAEAMEPTLVELWKKAGGQ